VKQWLGTLPGLVVCGGRSGGGREVREVRRLDLATMRWAPMPSLVSASRDHACCAVRGALVVLGGVMALVVLGVVMQGSCSSRVEILPERAEAFVNLPSLSCGEIWEATAIAVEESESAAGQVLLLDGSASPGRITSSVHLVDLATGMCTPQPDMLRALRYGFAAAKMTDGSIVCAGPGISAEVFGPPLQRGADAAWTWRALSDMSVGRYSSCGCVMTDGRFAVFGGMNDGALSTCEALSFHGDNYADAHWESLPPMHEAREGSVCATVAGCVIVVGGHPVKSCEVYHQARGRWLRLPCDVPCEEYLERMGSAMLLYK
jgi:hypothetical protein